MIQDQRIHRYHARMSVFFAKVPYLDLWSAIDAGLCGIASSAHIALQRLLPVAHPEVSSRK